MLKNLAHFTEAYTLWPQSEHALTIPVNITLFIGI